MTEHRQTIEQLLQKSRELENGSKRVQLLEEAVHLADGHDEPDAGFRSRLALMRAAVFAGRPDLLLAAFAWCLAAHDRDPERFEVNELLWNYKWAVENAVGLPQVSRTHIEAMLADMARRYAEAGSTLHAVHQKRRDVLTHMGDLDGAARADQQLAATPRDWLSDCRACVGDTDVGRLADQSRDEDALAKAAPILARRLKCAEVPHRTYARVLLPLLRLRRAREAMPYHHAGYRLIGSNPDFLPQAGMHLMFLVLTDNLARAVAVFQDHLPNALSVPSLLDRLKFFGAARLFLERQLGQDRRTLRLRLPPTFALFQPSAAYDTAALHDWFARQAAELAARFDARNGNDHYAALARLRAGTQRVRGADAAQRTARRQSWSCVAKVMSRSGMIGLFRCVRSHFDPVAPHTAAMCWMLLRYATSKTASLSMGSTSAAISANCRRASASACALSAPVRAMSCTRARPAIHWWLGSRLLGSYVSKYSWTDAACSARASSKTSQTAWNRVV